MTNQEVEALRIATGKIDDLLQRYAQCKKHEEMLNRAFTVDDWAQPIVQLDWVSGSSRVVIVPGGPNRQEFIRRIIELQKQITRENLAVLEDQIITQAGGLAPMLGFSRRSVADLALPAEEPVPSRIIDPIT